MPGEGRQVGGNLEEMPREDRECEREDAGQTAKEKAEADRLEKCVERELFRASLPNFQVGEVAKDKGTGKEQQIVIQSSGGLSSDEIERMVQEAADNAEADAARRETIEARNSADGIIHSTEQSLDEYKDQIDAAKAEELQTKISEVKEFMADEDYSQDVVVALNAGSTASLGGRPAEGAPPKSKSLTPLVVS